MSCFKNFTKLIFCSLLLATATSKVNADIDVFSYYDACRIWLGDTNIAATSNAAIAIKTGSLEGIDEESKWIIKSIHRLQGLKPEKILKLTDSIDVHYFLNRGYGEHTTNAGVNFIIMTKRLRSNVGQCKGNGAPKSVLHDPQMQLKFMQFAQALDESHQQSNVSTHHSQQHSKKQNPCCCVVL